VVFCLPFHPTTKKIVTRSVYQCNQKVIIYYLKLIFLCYTSLQKGGAMADYDFASRLKEARQRAGWTQTELGKRSGVHAMAISRLERGEKKDVTGATLRKLALALRVSGDYLLGLKDEMDDMMAPAA
jgi:DNA-binding XRE family transcriptional regulator